MVANARGPAFASGGWSRLWLGFGAANGLAAVALAAVAAHADLPADRLLALRSGIEIEGWHAPVLLLCALGRGRLMNAAGAAFAAGTVLFCAGVYAVALAGLHLGPIAPTGGTVLMLGWLLLLIRAVIAGET